MDAGETLGRYRIVREIARSNDVVYEAVDTIMGRRVALKELLLPPNLVGAARRERIERFYREAKAAGALSHRSIVTIYEVGESGGRHFIAMEYLEGHTLREMLQVQGPLPVERAREIALQVLDALAYAHSRGVVHRDIKPDNIHILPDGQVKITDFGIARIMGEPNLTTDGTVFGTPSYMSPEQVAGKPIDERTDLFSLGVTLYEMLTGRKPFTGESVVTITYQITTVQPEPPHGVPPGLQAVVMKALEKDVTKRYQSAAQMAADLRAEQPAAPMLTAPPAVNLLPGAKQAVMPRASPPAPPMHKPWWLSRASRSFLAALALTVVGGAVLFAMVLGLRAAYANYTRSVLERVSAEAFARATADYRAGRYLEAAQGFLDVARRAKGTRMAELARANAATAYAEMAASVEAKDRNAAVSLYRQAIRINPDDPGLHARLASLLYDMGLLEQAVQEWREVERVDTTGTAALAARHNIAVAYYNRAVILNGMGKTDEARYYFNKAVEADPGGDVAARALQQLGNQPPF